jgi:hypothetical protein
MECKKLAKEYDLDLIGSYLCYDLRKIKPPPIVLDEISKKFNLSLDQLEKIDYFDFVTRSIQIDLDSIEFQLGLHIHVVNQYAIGIDCKEIKIEEYNGIFYSYELDCFVDIMKKIISDNLTEEDWYDFFDNKLQ